MALALFDLDNTLLNGDSDHAWGMYLAKIGAVDPEEQKTKQDYFYQQYVNGTLDIYEFCEFQFSVLAKTPFSKLKEWHDDYMSTMIEPMIETGKADLIEKHRVAGDDIVIITATNDFVTAPIAKRLGVETLIATQAECVDGNFTGQVKGIPCFQDGKVLRLNEWLKQNNKKMDNSYFYSDSINDLPLLKVVDQAIAVTPDDKLRAHALKFDWPIID